MRMPARLRRLNYLVLSAVIAYTIFVEKVVLKTPIFHPLVDSLLTFFTSLGVYQLLLESVYLLVAKAPWLLRLYWGRLYLDGLWSYTYTIEGDDPSKIYFGIWRIEQDLLETRVVGFGLTDSFQVRSRVRSITDLTVNAGAHEFVNMRTDSPSADSDTLSRTNLYFILGKSWIFPVPARMHGRTIMYGGPFNGRLCNNSFIKHPKAKTEDDVIEDLRQNLRNIRRIHPT